jgi:hypothetical protein
LITGNHNKTENEILSFKHYKNQAANYRFLKSFLEFENKWKIENDQIFQAKYFILRDFNVTQTFHKAVKFI